MREIKIVHKVEVRDIVSGKTSEYTCDSAKEAFGVTEGVRMASLLDGRAYFVQQHDIYLDASDGHEIKRHTWSMNTEL